MVKITDKLVDSLEAPERGNRIVYDSDHKGAVIGFGCRVTANGARSFILRYIFERKEYRYTIGQRNKGWNSDAARDEARSFLNRMQDPNPALRTHPIAERQKVRDAHRSRAEASTYGEAVEDYVRREQEGKKQNATAGAVKRSLLVDGAEWKDKPLVDITASMIRRRLEEIRDGDLTADPPIKPRGYTANRFHAYLATFFRWAGEPGIELVPVSPMVGLRRPWEGEEARDRVYTDAELKALWKAGDALGGVAGAFLKLAMLTGKRRGAIASMRWSELSEDGLWTPPVDTRRRKRTKRLHGVPLPKLAQRVIAPLRPNSDDSQASPFVFPGRKIGSHIDAGSPFREAVRRESGIADFITHALRHTLETRLAELKVPPHVRDAALDHVPMRGSGASYDHWSYTPEIREALEKWADHIEGLVTPPGARALR